MISERMAFDRNLDRGEQSKAERKNNQKVGITSGDDLIDRELQVEWAGNHEKFEDHR